jgi:biopolymer transport protein ExbD
MKKPPEINTGSMADISFLLLTFFLLTSSINTDMGIFRKLPPPPDPNVKPADIKQRNIFTVLINKNDRLLVDNKPSDIRMLRQQAKDFISNPSNLETLPEKKLEEIPYLGNYMVSKGVISLQNDRGTSYDMYIKVQNELTAALNDLRDELSMDKFNRKFDELSDPNLIEAVQKAIPISISEAEPKDVGEQ